MSIKRKVKRTDISKTPVYKYHQKQDERARELMKVDSLVNLMAKSRADVDLFRKLKRG